jgi:hypothetical protein
LGGGVTGLVWKLTDIGFLAFQDIGNLLLDGKRDIGWFVILSINFRHKDREGG